MASPLLYSKKALSIEEQIKYLQSKNVIITNEQYAISILKRINYYRLKGYMLPFKKSDNSYEEINFYDLATLLRVDQLLRSLILKYTEHIEIKLRTFIVRALTKKHNSKGLEYLDPTYFNNFNRHKEFIDKLQKDFQNSDELYAHHYINNYDKYPIWVCIDILSFGSVSKLYGCLNSETQNEISSYYSNNIHRKRLKSYLFSLTYLRNKCAHFNRIYYKQFIKFPMRTEWFIEFGISPRNNKLFPQFVIMKDLCVDNLIWKNVLTELESIIENYKHVINLNHIGFPENWKDILTF